MLTLCNIMHCMDLTVFLFGHFCQDAPLEGTSRDKSLFSNDPREGWVPFSDEMCVPVH